MRPSFNTAGPCIPGEHYMLPPERRLGRLMRLIDEHKFFTLHAGRQTGKTTSLMWLEEHLNKEGRYRALWVDLQAAREEPDKERAFRTVLGKIARACELVHPDVPGVDPARIEALLMAFLQRVINGGRRIEREYGLGRKALDLLVFWRGERHAIEVKLRRDTETETRALDQIAGYLDRTGLSEGWLVLFDLRKERPWQEKLFVREIEHAGRRIQPVGC